LSGATMNLKIVLNSLSILNRVCVDAEDNKSFFKFCVRLKVIFLKKDDVCKLTESRLIY
jgi:hypothetical protein